LGEKKAEKWMGKREMDRGIWAAWYDLPEEGKEEYIAWLHDVHLPKALLRPGYLWAAHVENIWDEARKEDLSKRLTYTDDRSVPSGGAYLVLYGAASPHVFLKPSPAQLEANWTAEERDMFGRRMGVRSCIFLETDRVDGPDVNIRVPNGPPGPVIQFGSFNLREELDEETVMDMYAKIRLPLMAKMTGSVATRKLVSVYGWARHGILYEFVSLDLDVVKNKFAAQRKLQPDRELWKERLRGNLIHARGSPSLGKRIWPPVS
jgi:hypothetical protein